jgi:hypothetical protein
MEKRLNIGSRAAALGWVIAFGVLGSSTAFAGTITFYQITTDTSSIAGTSGYLDFQFNPGPGTTQAATATVVGFSSDGTLGGFPQLTGDAAGALPGDVVLNNTDQFNDYFEGFQFGEAVAFRVAFSGPAVTSPDGISNSGSTFAFSLYAADQVTPLLTSDPSGAVAGVDVNLDGTITPTSLSGVATVAPAPEPGSALLLVAGLLGLGYWKRPRRYSSPNHRP